MKNRCLQVVITLAAIGVASVHMIWPNIKIDSITITLLIVAIIPWVLPYIKGFEIPGVIKVDLPETKAATDKVVGSNVVIYPKSTSMKIDAHPATVKIEEDDPFDSLRKIALTDPNLAMVGFRIEVEKRIRSIAEHYSLRSERRPLGQLIQELRKREILSAQNASGLIELTALGNSAAHGAEVTPNAANWVVDVGPSIITQLEEIIRSLKNEK